MFIFRFVFYFILSFAILCIPVGDDRHLFDTLLGIVSPYTDTALKTVKQKISTTKKYTKKLYSNSNPKGEEDSVKSKQSGTLKNKPKAIHKVDGPPKDTYTEEEQERLRKVLNDSE